MFRGGGHAVICFSQKANDGVDGGVYKETENWYCQKFYERYENLIHTNEYPISNSRSEVKTGFSSPKAMTERNGNEHPISKY